jgi:hypothetical protein
VAPWVAGPLLLLAAPALAARLTALRFDALAIVFYLGLVFVWGFAEQSMRFLYPLAPFAWFYAVETIGRLAERMRKSDGVRPAAALLLFATIGGTNLAHVLMRLSLPEPDDIAEYRHSSLWQRVKPIEQVATAARLRRGIVADMSAVAEHVPAEDCVTSDVPPIVMAFAHRTADPTPWTTLAGAIAQADDARCRYYHLAPSTWPAGTVSLDELRRVYDVVYVSPNIPYPDSLPTGYLLRRRAGMNAR